MASILRAAGILLITAGITLFLFLAFARAYDYEQSSAKPRLGKALVCVGRAPAPVLCSYHASRVTWFYTGKVL